MIRVGKFEICSVITGRYRLDGGAMFGVVPRVLWEKKAPPDRLNRIAMTMRTLLAVDRQAERVVLVDTGPGDKWSPEEAARFDIQPDSAGLPRALAEQGLSEADVTDVVIAHLHFDHNGGLTEWAGQPGGSTRLRYPQARHWIHQRHWHHATNPTEKDRASFLERDLQALAEPGVLTFVTGDKPPPPFEGVRWLLSHGHTPYQLLPLFEGPAGGLLFVGDLIPTANHLPLPWVMAYDLQPLVTLEEKRAVYRRCAEDGTMLAFPHDLECGGVALHLEKGRPEVARVLDL
jgi:glyoxylase-like metal-dependent hydrolase (beta-lactamase superfamily II)